MKKAIIGIDLGATLIKSSIVFSEPQLVNESYIPTDRKKVLVQLREVIKEHMSFARKNSIDLRGLGLGIPGVVDQINGTIKFTLNLGLNNVEIKKILYPLIKLPILIDSDRNLGLLGEFYYGKARSCNNVAAISWGTGVACSLLINSKVYRGSHGIVTEFGHTLIKKNGRRCKCGNKGCLGAYSGGDVLINSLNALLKRDKISTPRYEVIRKSFNLIEKDKKYHDIFRKAIENLAVGIANLCNIVDPEKVLIWGGMSNLPDEFLELLNKEVKMLSHPTYKDYVRIERALHKEKSGLFGALALFDKNAE